MHAVTHRLPCILPICAVLMFATLFATASGAAFAFEGQSTSLAAQSIVFESEPNDSYATATPIAVDEVVSASISKSSSTYWTGNSETANGDQDFFKLTLPHSGTVVLTCANKAQRNYMLANLKLYVMNEYHEEVGNLDVDLDTLRPNTTKLNLEQGSYFIRVVGYRYELGYDIQATYDREAATVASLVAFTDLNYFDWYMNAENGAFPGTSELYLDYTVTHGLMSGYSGTNHFGPDDKLSRGMAATIIYRMATGKTAENTNNSVSTKFSDVPNGQWYAAAVKWCSDNGVVTGYSGTAKFDPDGNVTREQLAAMIARYCENIGGMAATGGNVSKFKDGSRVNSWAREGVSFCSSHGIVSGIGSSGNFDPQGDATRCQMAKIIAVTARLVGR